ncbi:MAG: hypothetical protein DWQ20_00750 [Actinobacteria bacterium]|nr:MAG: hypothetical protein DWQ20_00750 [Actinomycetota bacterium]
MRPLEVVNEHGGRDWEGLIGYISEAEASDVLASWRFMLADTWVENGPPSLSVLQNVLNAVHHRIVLGAPAVEKYRRVMRYDKGQKVDRTVEQKAKANARNRAYYARRKAS